MSLSLIQMSISWHQVSGNDYESLLQNIVLSTLLLEIYL